eukprot:gnl/MRDRNA2_/MRDRNA2_73275_c0_seq1.p1 gnl/MRDRNA2_/MRDRNA2_73275_c0~~gnl/MRDRNA2_/MRDRNA2_73275_c0_seq1.p1  ORF type:complete len:415 (+),score=64.22 gnl/MRDRNA2_/MRDRNA2_73275_c0_seq1:67-1311(+)
MCATLGSLSVPPGLAPPSVAPIRPSGMLSPPPGLTMSPTPPDDEPWQVVTPSMASYFASDASLAFEEARAPPSKLSQAGRLAVIRGAPPHATARHIADSLAWLGLNTEQMMPSEGPLEGGVAVVLFASEDDMQACLELDAADGLAIFDSCGWRWPLSCERAYHKNTKTTENEKDKYKFTPWTSAYETGGLLPPWSPASMCNWLGTPLGHSDLCEPLNLSLLGGLQQHLPGDQFKLPEAQIQDNASDATDRSTRTPDSKQETLDQDSITGSPGNTRGRGRWKSPGYGPNLAERYRSKDVPITTMMIRNIPCRFRQAELMSIIDGMGFGNTYDFFYLPMDSRKNANLGYAFINFWDVQSAEYCASAFKGVQLAPYRSPKTCRVTPASIQGLANLRKHFKATTVSRNGREPMFLDCY